MSLLFFLREKLQLKLVDSGSLLINEVNRKVKFQVPVNGETAKLRTSLHFSDFPTNQELTTVVNKTHFAVVCSS
jgi:hypothetical protein